MADNITCRICLPFYSEFEEAKKCWQKLLIYGTHIPGRYIYEGIEFEIEPRQGTYIHALRNDLITDYTKTKSTAPLPFDYFFFIDSDVSCKNDIDDVVSLIKKAEKIKCNIIGGPYLKHGTDKYYVWDERDNFIPCGKGVQPVAMLGTGFMCISRRAFQDLEPPWFYYPKVPGRFYPESEDKNFCKLVGKEVYIDWDIQLYHRHRSKDLYRWDLTLKEDYMSEKKTKENRSAEQVIREKWRLKKQHETAAQSLVQQILGIADLTKIDAGRLNEIIGEQVFRVAKPPATPPKPAKNVR